jgi:hypothetical protein
VERSPYDPLDSQDFPKENHPFGLLGVQSLGVLENRRGCPVAISSPGPVVRRWQRLLFGRGRPRLGALRLRSL